MTCIVGLIDNGTVLMGGDSAGVDGLSLVVRRDPKVFQNGGFLIGYTSSFRMGQLLAHAFTPPTPREGQDVFAFMVTDFVDALRTCFKDGGYATRKNDVEEGGTFLVGFRDRLFHIEDDYQVGEAADPFTACGCGQDVALGSLHSTTGRDPHDRIQMALNAAERFSAGVRGPFVVAWLPTYQDAQR